MIDTLPIRKQLVKQSRIEKLNVNDIPFGKIYTDHMFVADYKQGEWRDFRIVPYDRISLTPGTTVLHYAQSVFEGLKAHKNNRGEIQLFRPLENFKRLNVSAERMCIPEIPEEVFMSGMLELIKQDQAWIPQKPGTSLYVRPFVFATDEYIGIRPSDNYKFMIITCPVGAYYSEPVKVKIETKYSRAFPGGTGYAKAAGNYAASLYPARIAHEEGYHQLIWTDGVHHQYVEESGTMNLMFVIDGELLTAPVGDTILRGITRDSVLKLARDWGIPLEERPISIKEVIAAIKEDRLEEAFGTGTAATIAPISQIGYENNDYKLPAVKDENFSLRVMKELDDIKLGNAEDKFSWMFKVS